MKSLRLRVAVCISTITILAVTVPNVLASIKLWDDFDCPILDLTKWSYQDRDWPQGQTWFKGAPNICGGIATFMHHTYNPFDPGNSCLGQEIYSNSNFARGAGLEIEARVRVRCPIASGLVTSFFAYMDKEMPTGISPWSDEIDFEFLSNQINDPPESCGDRVLVASSNDLGAPGSGYGDGVHHQDANPAVLGLDLTEFNVFKIRWLADSVEWYWDPDQVRGQDLYPDVLIYKTSNAVPDEPLTVRFNFWASTKDWPLAWDSAMQPTADPAGDLVCYYDVDYVAVRQIAAPTSGAEPQAQIAEILDFFDESVANGDLVGKGAAWSPESRLNTLRWMLQAASDFIDHGFYQAARVWLWFAYRRCDGQPMPADYVTGPAIGELAAMIQHVMDSLECQ
jgi:hypothetical protein